MNKIYLLFIVAVLGLAACEQDGPLENAGEQMDEAAEEVADEIDDATD
jgi:predicted small lipoprotein YifL